MDNRAESALSDRSSHWTDFHPGEPPHGVRVTVGRDGLRLRVPWFSASALAMVFAGLLFLPAAATFLPPSRTNPLGASVMAYAVPALVFASGCMLLCCGLGLALNGTTLALNDKRFTVRHGPLPWPWLQPLATSAENIQRVHCRSCTLRSRRTPHASDLIADLRDGRQVCLIDRLYDVAEAPESLHMPDRGARAASPDTIYPAAVERVSRIGSFIADAIMRSPPMSRARTFPCRSSLRPCRRPGESASTRRRSACVSASKCSPGPPSP